MKKSNQDYMAAMMEGQSAGLDTRLPSWDQTVEMLIEDLDGAGIAQGTMQTNMPTGNPVGMGFEEEEYEEEEGREEFSAEELKLGERYINLAGGADRARELLDTVEECGECVGLAGDERDERDEIEGISDAMPGLPDLPTDHFDGI